MGLDLLRDLRAGVALSEFTTWRVGGRAECFAEPDQQALLLELVAEAQRRGLPLQLIGAGSNLLVSDAGLPGLVICTRRLQGARLEPGDGLVEAEAGEPIPTLARRAARAGLGGLEWSVGIPGTVGGAVVMNAGAQGGCVADCLRDVTVVDPATGRTAVLSSRDLNFAYRHSRLQEEPLVVLSARFQLQPGQNPDAVSARTSSNLHSRTSTQPYQLPSCGSVFRNPEPQKAGRLIEGLGLKGHRIGGAEVSTLHANFIVNTGAARADDMAALITHIQDRVEEAHGIRLHPEVMRLGRFGTGS